MNCKSQKIISNHRLANCTKIIECVYTHFACSCCCCYYFEILLCVNAQFIISLVGYFFLLLFYLVCIYRRRCTCLDTERISLLFLFSYNKFKVIKMKMILCSFIRMCVEITMFRNLTWVYGAILRGRNYTRNWWVCFYDFFL